MEFKIYEANYQHLQKKVQTINKKAVKLGVKPFTLSIILEQFIETESKTYKLFTVELTGETIKLNDYEFCAVVRPQETGNVIHSVKDVPSYFRTMKPTCQHCNIDRKRNEYYIVRNTISNEYKMVGSSCLKDFIGHASPLQYAELMEYLANDDWAEVFKAIPQGTAVKNYIKTKDFIDCAIYATEKHGWISSEKAKEQYLKSTRDRALELLYSHQYLSLENHSQLITIINWVQTFQPQNNEFLDNLLTIAKTDYITERECGQLAYLPIAYAKQMEYENKVHVEFKQEYLGVVDGKFKLSVTCKLLKIIVFDSFYGQVYIHRFLTDTGYLVIWKTSKEMGEEGVDYKLTGTVKSHEKYRDEYQTIVKNCKLAEV